MTHYPTPEHRRLAEEGLYRPDLESDACGVGLVAATDGKPSRRVVEAAIEALRAVWHRGAVDADGKTGDGAGIHVDLPDRFFDDRSEEHTSELQSLMRTSYAVFCLKKKTIQ